MRSMSDTITRLAALRQHSADTSVHSSRLVRITGFGTNPGALNAYSYVPERRAGTKIPLVVVLHGCTQSAAGYDHGSGWSRLAEEQGFAVLYPEQSNANNPNGCFNWFAREHNRRGGGEALSIRQMVEYMIDEHRIDPSQVFVTGLSAGGAMAAVMLATYPDVFAGGGVIAGLPYGTADTIPQAFDRMRGHGFPDAADLEGLVRNATTHDGAWPTLSIWHGTADYTVMPTNADAIVSQWSRLHDVDTEPTLVEHVSGHERRVWVDRQGREVVEHYLIKGMGHGTPLDTTRPSHEVAGAYMTHAGISSTRSIAAFWKIAPGIQDGSAEPGGSVEVALQSQDDRSDTRPQGARRARPVMPESGAAIGETIKAALRKAGLMP